MNKESTQNEDRKEMLRDYFLNAYKIAIALEIAEGESTVPRETAQPMAHAQGASLAEAA